MTTMLLNIDIGQIFRLHDRLPKLIRHHARIEISAGAAKTARVRMRRLIPIIVLLLKIGQLYMMSIKFLCKDTSLLILLPTHETLIFYIGVRSLGPPSRLFGPLLQSQQRALGVNYSAQVIRILGFVSLNFDYEMKNLYKKYRFLPILFFAIISRLVPMYLLVYCRDELLFD